MVNTQSIGLSDKNRKETHLGWPNDGSCSESAKLGEATGELLMEIGNENSVNSDMAKVGRAYLWIPIDNAENDYSRLWLKDALRVL